jgi:hypothetical protein
LSLLEFGGGRIGLIGMSHAFQGGGQNLPGTPRNLNDFGIVDGIEDARARSRPKRLQTECPPYTPSEMQQRAGTIATSFEPDDFDPLLSNNHVQTIGGFLLRDTAAAFVPRDDPIGAVSRIVQGMASKMFLIKQQQQQQQQQQPQESSRRTKFWNFRERIETPDGDWFHADTLFPTATSKQQERRDVTVLLLHSLESNSDSVLSHQMAASFAAQGMTVTCLNFRSCSQNEAGEFIPNDSLGGCEYHSPFVIGQFVPCKRVSKISHLLTRLCALCLYKQITWALQTIYFTT